MAKTTLMAAALLLLLPTAPFVGASEAVPLAPGAATGVLPLSALATPSFGELNTGPVSGIGSPDLLASVLTDDQLATFARVMRWNTLSIAALGANTLAFLVAVAVDPFVGGIAGILTVGFWTISTGYMAFGYGDLITDLAASGSKARQPKAQSWESILAASFGIGAITAIGLSFDDDTGVAETLAYVCLGVSTISGILAIVGTFNYAREVEYAAYKQRVSVKDPAVWGPDTVHGSGAPADQPRA